MYSMEIVQRYRAEDKETRGDASAVICNMSIQCRHYNLAVPNDQYSCNKDNVMIML